MEEVRDTEVQGWSGREGRGRGSGADRSRGWGRVREGRGRRSGADRGGGVSKRGGAEGAEETGIRRHTGGRGDGGVAEKGGTGHTGGIGEGGMAEKGGAEEVEQMDQRTHRR